MENVVAPLDHQSTELEINSLLYSCWWPVFQHTFCIHPPWGQGGQVQHKDYSSYELIQIVTVHQLDHVKLQTLLDSIYNEATWVEMNPEWNQSDARHLRKKANTEGYPLLWCLKIHQEARISQTVGRIVFSLCFLCVFNTSTPLLDPPPHS